MKRALFALTLAAVTCAVSLSALAIPPSYALLTARTNECRIWSDVTEKIYDLKRLKGATKEQVVSGMLELGKRPIFHTAVDVVFDRQLPEVDGRMFVFSKCLDNLSVND